MDRQKLWEKFVSSGSVKDYLEYAQFTNVDNNSQILSNCKAEMLPNYNNSDIIISERNGRISDSNYSGNSFERN